LTSSSGYLGYELYSGLWSGHTEEDLVFQSANAGSGLVKLMDGQSTKFRMEPTNDFSVVSAFMECWDDVEFFPVTISGSSWDFAIDDGSLTMFQLEGGRHSLFGFNRHGDQD
jgi:hypothetical protein